MLYAKGGIPVSDTGAQIRQLALCFHLLAGLVLLDAFLLQTFEAKHSTNHLLARADRLVP